MGSECGRRSLGDAAGEGGWFWGPGVSAAACSPPGRSAWSAPRATTTRRTAWRAPRRNKKPPRRHEAAHGAPGPQQGREPGWGWGGEASPFRFLSKLPTLETRFCYTRACNLHRFWDTASAGTGASCGWGRRWDEPAPCPALCPGKWGWVFGEPAVGAVWAVHPWVQGRGWPGVPACPGVRGVMRWGCLVWV